MAKFTERATQIANKIIDTFQNGNLPKSLAQCFILHKGNRHADSYSFSNQFIVLLSGYSDARGYNAWLKVGRRVIAGQKAIYILAPMMVQSKTNRDGEEKKIPIIIGYKDIPVFGTEQTEIIDQELWEKHAPENKETQTFINELPLKGVADAWGINISTYNGRNSQYKGWYKQGFDGSKIALGVENLSTWAHELIHAADDKLGNLKSYKTSAGKLSAEVVAEFGGAILLHACGYEREADIGGAFEYIQSYVNGDKSKVAQTCMQLIDRTCKAVALILETAGVEQKELVTAE